MVVVVVHDGGGCGGLGGGYGGVGGVSAMAVMVVVWVLIMVVVVIMFMVVVWGGAGADVNTCSLKSFYMAHTVFGGVLYCLPDTPTSSLWFQNP